ncbi:MAG: glycine--tRNA ligase [Candidatus Wildermuthbacteria bacterium]|nr:glycine--tRNA ligase [Candidatus Wildermuthbacteria bacterium]
MEKIVSLCKRRGFVFPGSEIYGGLSNSWDYGPLGIELKNNIKQLWWKKFVQSRDDMVGIDAALIMNPKVWEASGHIKNFTDPLIECKKCNERFRADSINTNSSCPKCGAKGQFTEAKQFNLMLKTFLGPVDDATSAVYFRPEIAQSMFVDFKQALETTRRRLPFGIASQGKAFRNEITPGNFIFRTREFNLMELEYFVEEKEWGKWFEYWQNEMREWLKDLGVNLKKIHEVEIKDGERAHYSKRTVDFEYEYPFGQKELYGLAYRADFDLKNHEKFSGQNLKYRDPESGEEIFPHVIEPTFGLDRSVLVALLEAYHEEEGRVVLKLPFKLAPYKAAVFPLLANKPELVNLARKIYDDLRKDFMVAFDDRGNIGKRYYSQDEIGTPHCITCDFDSLEKNDVTIRDRDTMKQERVKITDLANILKQKLEEK